MYTVTVEIQRTVVEKYECELEADGLEEALDVAYEHFSTFPNSDIDLISRRRISEDTVDVNVICAEFERETIGENDDGGDQRA